MSTNTEGIRKFVVSSVNSGYANPEVAILRKDDGSHIITHSEGAYDLEDRFFGGEPYSGEVVIRENGKPVWTMEYRGWLHDTNENPDAVYGFLRKALQQVPEESPYRGPKEFADGSWVYRNRWNGDMENFCGEETILKSDKAIYKGLYFGGAVDSRRD